MANRAASADEATGVPGAASGEGDVGSGTSAHSGLPGKRLGDEDGSVRITHPIAPLKHHGFREISSARRSPRGDLKGRLFEHETPERIQAIQPLEHSRGAPNASSPAFGPRPPNQQKG